MKKLKFYTIVIPISTIWYLEDSLRNHRLAMQNMEGTEFYQRWRDMQRYRPQELPSRLDLDPTAIARRSMDIHHRNSVIWTDKHIFKDSNLDIDPEGNFYYLHNWHWEPIDWERPSEMTDHDMEVGDALTRVPGKVTYLKRIKPKPVEPILPDPLPPTAAIKGIEPSFWSEILWSAWGTFWSVLLSTIIVTAIVEIIQYHNFLGERGARLTEAYWAKFDLTNQQRARAGKPPLKRESAKWMSGEALNKRLIAIEEKMLKDGKMDTKTKMKSKHKNKKYFRDPMEMPKLKDMSLLPMLLVGAHKDLRNFFRSKLKR